MTELWKKKKECKQDTSTDRLCGTNKERTHRWEIHYSKEEACVVRNAPKSHQSQVKQFDSRNNQKALRRLPSCHSPLTFIFNKTASFFTAELLFWCIFPDILIQRSSVQLHHSYRKSLILPAHLHTVYWNTSQKGKVMYHFILTSYNRSGHNVGNNRNQVEIWSKTLEHFMYSWFFLNKSLTEDSWVLQQCQFLLLLTELAPPRSVADTLSVFRNTVLSVTCHVGQFHVLQCGCLNISCCCDSQDCQVCYFQSRGRHRSLWPPLDRPERRGNVVCCIQTLSFS